MVWLIKRYCNAVSFDQPNHVEMLAIWNPPWLFGWPTPGEYAISPLAIVDGVTVPFNISYTFQQGKANDVSGKIFLIPKIFRSDHRHHA